MNKRFIKSVLPALFLLLILIYLSSGNDKDNEVYKRSRLLLGTLVEINVVDTSDTKRSHEGVEEAFKEIKRLESLLGRRQQGSDIREINSRQGEKVAVSPETLELAQKSLAYERKTNGAFDMTLGRLTELWGFEGDRKAPPPEDEVKSALARSGSGNIDMDLVNRTIRVKNGVHLDLGGIAKGYIIDKAGALLRERGIYNFIINAGGDMLISGKKGDHPWRIGFQHPRKPKEIIARMDIESEHISVVTSGDYERYFMHEGKRYHHILDPKTGYPAKGLTSVTVTAGDAATADALSTSIFVLGLKEGMALVNSTDGVECMLVDSQERVHLSNGLKGKVDLR